MRDLLDATVRLVKSPQYSGLWCLALRMLSSLLTLSGDPEHKPIGLEGIRWHARGLSSPQADVRSTTSHCCRHGRGFLLVEFGADTNADASAERIASWPPHDWPRIPRASCTRQKRPSASGGYANPLLAQYFCPGSARVGRGGRTPPFRRRSWAPIFAPFRAVDEFGYSMPIYGHFGQGCIHTRMSYDFRSVKA